jgi:hypothetical protein
MSYKTMAAKDGIVGIYPILPTGESVQSADLSQLTPKSGPFGAAYESFHYLAPPRPQDLSCTVIRAQDRPKQIGGGKPGEIQQASERLGELPRNDDAIGCLPHVARAGHPGLQKHADGWRMRTQPAADVSETVESSADSRGERERVTPDGRLCASGCPKSVDTFSDMAVGGSQRAIDALNRIGVP